MLRPEFLLSFIISKGEIRFDYTLECEKLFVAELFVNDRIRILSYFLVAENGVNRKDTYLWDETISEHISYFYGYIHCFTGQQCHQPFNCHCWELAQVSQ